MNNNIKLPIRCHIAGVTYEDRQNVCSRVRKGDILQLEPEYDNPYDSNAIVVKFAGNVCGYIPKEFSKSINRRLQYGENICCKSIDILGGDVFNIGIEILISSNEEFNEKANTLVSKSESINKWLSDEIRCPLSNENGFGKIYNLRNFPMEFSIEQEYDYKAEYEYWEVGSKSHLYRKKIFFGIFQNLNDDFDRRYDYAYFEKRNDLPFNLSNYNENSIDSSTNLIWAINNMRVVNNYEEALEILNEVNNDISDDKWRIPTVPELLTLFYMYVHREGSKNRNILKMLYDKSIISSDYSLGGSFNEYYDDDYGSGYISGHYLVNFCNDWGGLGATCSKDEKCDLIFCKNFTHENLIYDTTKTESIKVPIIDYEMVYIPPGKFQMGGSYENPLYSKRNQFEVEISKGFYIGKYLVDNLVWEKGINLSLAEMHNQMKTFSSEEYEYDDLNGIQDPVQVAFHNVLKFLNEINSKILSNNKAIRFDLCTEAEWEYSCRAGTSNKYFFGNDDEFLSNFAWFKNDKALIYEDYAHKVGMLLHNPFGIYDMLGNVWEFTRDGFTINNEFPNVLIDPEIPYDLSLGYDQEIVIKGGDHSSSSKQCECGYRTSAPIESWAAAECGFRLALYGAKSDIEDALERIRLEQIVEQNDFTITTDDDDDIPF